MELNCLSDMHSEIINNGWTDKQIFYQGDSNKIQLLIYNNKMITEHVIILVDHRYIDRYSVTANTMSLNRQVPLISNVSIFICLVYILFKG